LYNDLNASGRANDRKGFMSVLTLQKTAPADRAPSLLDVFPRRRILIHYAGVATTTAFMVLFGLFMLAMALGWLYSQAPGVASDFAMSREGKAVQEPAAGVSGQCKRMKFVFIDCNAKISYQPDPASPRRETVEQDFFFVGLDYATEVAVLRSTIHPERVTTTLAIDHLTNRILTTVVFGIGFILGGLACIREAWTNARCRKLEGQSLMLRPQQVSVIETDEHNTVRFNATIDGKLVKHSNRMRNGDSPLYLGNQGYALAVQVPGSPHLILIDHDMTVLGFTDPERAQIRAAAV
jgi:hypothetical protein